MSAKKLGEQQFYFFPEGAIYKYGPIPYFGGWCGSPPGLFLEQYKDWPKAASFRTLSLADVMHDFWTIRRAEVVDDKWEGKYFCELWKLPAQSKGTLTFDPATINIAYPLLIGVDGLPRWSGPTSFQLPTCELITKTEIRDYKIKADYEGADSSKTYCGASVTAATQSLSGTHTANWDHYCVRYINGVELHVPFSSGQVSENNPYGWEYDHGSWTEDVTYGINFITSCGDPENELRSAEGEVWAVLDQVTGEVQGVGVKYSKVYPGTLDLKASPTNKVHVYLSWSFTTPHPWESSLGESFTNADLQPWDDNGDAVYDPLKTVTLTMDDATEEDKLNYQRTLGGISEERRKEIEELPDLLDFGGPEHQFPISHLDAFPIYATVAFQYGISNDPLMPPSPSGFIPSINATCRLNDTIPVSCCEIIDLFPYGLPEGWPPERRWDLVYPHPLLISDDQSGKIHVAYGAGLIDPPWWEHAEDWVSYATIKFQDFKCASASIKRRIQLPYEDQYIYGGDLFPTLICKPTEYWPYANSRGAPIWDINSGHQINDPCS